MIKRTKYLNKIIPFIDKPLINVLIGVRSFNFIHDNYPKYIISADKFDFSRNNIKHYNIIDFLLNT